VDYGYRIKFHTENKSVTVLLLLPYCLEASVCAGILEDWLAFKAKKEQRLQIQLKTGEGKRKSYRPLPKDGVVVNRVSIIPPQAVLRERQNSTPIVSLTIQDKNFIYQKKRESAR
jgi:hypothetical protein